MKICNGQTLDAFDESVRGDRNIIYGDLVHVYGSDNVIYGSENIIKRGNYNACYGTGNKIHGGDKNMLFGPVEQQQRRTAQTYNYDYGQPSVRIAAEPVHTMPLPQSDVQDRYDSEDEENERAYDHGVFEDDGEDYGDSDYEISEDEEEEGLIPKSPDFVIEQPTEEEAPSTECSVCMNAVKNTILRPCNHYAVCNVCAQILKHSNNPLCPFCRKKIESYERVYNT